MQQRMNSGSPENKRLPAPAGHSSVNPRKPRTSALVALGFGLLVILPLSYPALDYLMPSSPGQGQIAASRAGWYFNHAQWRADMRTLFSAIEFVMDMTPDAPTGASVPTNTLAAPTRPTDTNPPAPSQVRDNDFGFLEFRS